MSIAELEAAGLSPLAYFEQALRRLNYAVAYQPQHNSQPEQLLVVAGKDQQGQKIMARLRLLTIESECNPEQESLPVILENLMVLPQTCSLSQQADLNLLACIFNRSAPIGAFFASSEWGLCYRYQQLSESAWISLNIIVNTLQQMLATSLACLPYFNAYLAGETISSLCQRLESEAIPSDDSD